MLVLYLYYASMYVGYGPELLPHSPIHSQFIDCRLNDMPYKFYGVYFIRSHSYFKCFWCAALYLLLLLLLFLCWFWFVQLWKSFANIDRWKFFNSISFCFSSLTLALYRCCASLCDAFSRLRFILSSIHFICHLVSLLLYCHSFLVCSVIFFVLVILTYIEYRKYINVNRSQDSDDIVYVLFSISCRVRFNTTTTTTMNQRACPEFKHANAYLQMNAAKLSGIWKAFTEIFPHNFINILLFIFWVFSLIFFLLLIIDRLHAIEPETPFVTYKGAKMIETVKAYHPLHSLNSIKKI